MTAPIYVEMERHVHQTYLRHQKREQRISGFIATLFVLAGVFSICIVLAACAYVGLLISEAAR